MRGKKCKFEKILCLFLINDPISTQQKATERIRNHSFSSYAKFLEKVIFLTPWYARSTRTCVYHGVKNSSFSENFAF